MTTRSDRLPHGLAGLFLLAVMAGCATAPVAPRGRPELPFPSPLSGPGVPQLPASARKSIDQGWRALLAGDSSQALRRATQAGTNPAASLLTLQARVQADPQSSLDGLATLVEANPEYASAWITLSYAAQAAGQEAQALRAARRAAGLWRSQHWLQRAAQLEDRWVGSRLAQADEALGSGDPATAARYAGLALAADPGNRRASLLLARADMEEGRTDEALKLLRQFRGDPDALLLEGRIAENRGQWTRSMELYQQLPDTDPRKKPALDRVKKRWRIANMPAYVQEAISSPALTRGQLAVLLGNLLPQLLALPVGEVPLMTDIVDLPSQREIVAVVAAGLMRADPIEHTFSPLRQVTAEQAGRVVRAAVELTGQTPPRLCPGPERQADCFPLSNPPTGEQVTAILIHMEEDSNHE